MRQLRHAGVLHISAPSAHLRRHKPGGTQVQHSTALAAYADFVFSTTDGLNRAWSAEEGDWSPLTITGLATISMVNQHHVALPRDQETPRPLLLCAGLLGKGELLTGHGVFGCAGGNIPDFDRAVIACGDQSGAVKKLHLSDRTAAKVSARSSVSALYENLELGAPSIG